MALTICKSCDHGNPPDSKFCNSCGAMLTLAPCPHCGAVNDVNATTCYECRGNLQPARTEEPIAVPVTQPAPRRPSQVVFATAAMVFAAGIGYYAYRQSAPESPSTPAAVKIEAQSRSEPAPAASAPGPVATPAVPVAEKPPAPAVPAPAAVVEPPKAIATPPASTPPSAPPRAIARQTEAQAPPSPAAAPITRARPGTAKPAEAETPRIGPCTERLAALGLCTYRQQARNDTRIAPPIPAEVPRPPASTGTEPCTEAVAALGLCQPNSR